MISTLIKFQIIDGFSSSQSFCISHLLFNLDCWGCGSGRAAVELLNGNFKNALNLNFSIIIFPLIIYIWFKKINLIKKEELKWNGF